MAKLKDYEFEFLIDIALSTKDKEMFEDLIKRQNESSFLDFSKKTPNQKKELSFEDQEKEELVKNLRSIMKFYQDKGGKLALENLVDDVENALDRTSERMINHEIDSGNFSAQTIKFSSSPIQYIAVSYEEAQDAYNKYSFPGEDLDSFVARYFFGDSEGDML